MHDVITALKETGLLLQKVDSKDTTYRANCPFHDDELNKFTVEQSEQKFYCAGCGQVGALDGLTEKLLENAAKKTMQEQQKAAQPSAPAKKKRKSGRKR